LGLRQLEPMLKPRPFPDTRASLLANLQTGGRAGGWRDFYEQYAPAVFRVARLRGLADPDAEDIVQQVMLSVVQHIEGFAYDQDRGQFRQWVRLVTENKIRDLRRRHPHMELDESAELPDGSAAIDEIWDHQWRVQDILLCLDEVATDEAPRRIEAFRMYVLEGRPAQSVAQELGLSIGYLYVIRSEIINRVRERMRMLSSESGRRS